jgi:hypothetical protein
MGAEALNGTTSGTRRDGPNGSAVSRSNPTKVFTGANGYMTVLHLGNPTGDPQTAPRPNSVNPGTNDATPFYPDAHPAPLAKGVVGMADSLRGQGSAAAGDYLHLGVVPATNFPTGLSMSAWIKPISYNGTNFIQFFTLGNRTSGEVCPPCAAAGNGTNSIWFGRVGNANNFMGAEALNGTTSGTRRDGPNGSAALGEWQHFTMTLLGTGTGSMNLYRNGVQILTNTNNTQALVSISRNANFLGRATWGDPTTIGLFDEARISTVVRSANWAKLEYKNQKPAVTPVFDLAYSQGSYSFVEEAPIAGISAPTAMGTATRYAVSPALPVGLSLNGATGEITGTPLDGSASQAYTVTAYGDSAWSTTTSFNLTIIMIRTGSGPTISTMGRDSNAPFNSDVVPNAAMRPA